MPPKRWKLNADDISPVKIEFVSDQFKFVNYQHVKNIIITSIVIDLSSKDFLLYL